MTAGQKLGVRIFAEQVDGLPQRVRTLKGEAVHCGSPLFFLTHAARGTVRPDFCRAAHTVAGVAGMATLSVPTASVMALMTAAGAAIAPASPQPLMPSGLDGHLVNVVSTWSDGRHSARGIV